MTMMTRSQGFNSVALMLLGLSLCSCQQSADPSPESGEKPMQSQLHNPTPPKPPPPPPPEDPGKLDPDNLPELLTEEDYLDGWIKLFDGKTLFGWKANSDTDWYVKDGVIVAEGAIPGQLMTTFQLADYDLRFDYRLEKGGNSGVFLRSTFAPKDPTTECYEFNMCDTHPDYPTGSIVGREKVNQNIANDGEWKSVRIQVAGNRISAAMGGEKILNFIDKGDQQRKSGFIGLQCNIGKIEFRNIMLKPAELTDLFDDHTLNGWREVPDSKSKFQATSHTLHVVNGPGFLETEKTFADFVLQANLRTNGKALNSGIFFRAMKGSKATPSNGYEIQIHNGYDNGDRTQPNNAGTGAIFRRNTVRMVASNDQEWTALTLIANGPHFSVWVNGLQVTDWTDERKPDVNPRKGQRLKAGHISLQGHDPTTDLYFKDIRAAEIPSTSAAAE